MRTAMLYALALVSAAAGVMAGVLACKAVLYRELGGIAEAIPMSACMPAVRKSIVAGFACPIPFVVMALLFRRKATQAANTILEPSSNRADAV